MQFKSIQQRFIEPIENDLWLHFFYLAKLTKIQSRSSTPWTWPCFQWNPKPPILNRHHQFASRTSHIERSKAKIHEELSLQKTSGKSYQVKQTKQNRKEKNQKCSSSSNNFFFLDRPRKKIRTARRIKVNQEEIRVWRARLGTYRGILRSVW